MMDLETNAPDMSTQLQITQDGVGGTYELLQICKDVAPVKVMNFPSASPEQDVMVGFSNSVHIGELLSSSSSIVEGDLVAEEAQGQANPHELSRSTEATFLSSANDILPIKLQVDAEGGGTYDQVSSTPVVSKSVSKEENSVLQKLLRKWRYFDSGDVNLYSEGHAVNSAVQNRRKPCYVCGDVRHNGKKCRKRRTCYTCTGKGHVAEDCPKSDKIYDICLRCGETGHDLFSCSNDYSSDDLKKIRCYVCNEVGHLCCGSYIDINPAPASCCNCGESGHSGLECPKPGLNKGSSQPPSICYKCGEQGHVGRNCTISKVGIPEQKCISNPKGEVLDPMTSQLGQDESAMADLTAEPNNAGVRQGQRKARKYKTYRRGRVKKQKKGSIDPIAEQ